MDAAGRYRGLERRAVEEAFREADLFIDLGTHGAWLDEAAAGPCLTVLVDGEPGYTQMRREQRLERGEAVPEYDLYYSNGASLGSDEYSGPTCGVAWRTVFNPVVLDLVPTYRPPSDSPFTTVMNWRSHAPDRFHGTTWGQKDVEFAKFITLPERVSVPMEIAVAGRVSRTTTSRAGVGRPKMPDTSTVSYDSFIEYVIGSAGEFAVCKEAYVALRTGWFSDRQCCLPGGRTPGRHEDTGFGAFLPCGVGLLPCRPSTRPPTPSEEMACTRAPPHGARDRVAPRGSRCPPRPLAVSANAGSASEAADSAAERRADGRG